MDEHCDFKVMHLVRQHQGRCVRCARLIAAAMVFCLSTGCASMLNPATGIPAHRLPPEVLGESRENLKLIDLALLGQKQPEAYLLGPGDILGLWIEGVLGERGQLPPVQLPEGGEAPSLGYPVPVRENGTVPLPLIEPVRVSGMTVADAEKEIIKAYTVTKQILVPGRERVIVTLVRKRTYHVLVVRQEFGASVLASPSGRGGITSTTNVFQQSKLEGSGNVLDLPAYQNDVLNALVKTGGLPSGEAADEIVIQRGVFAGEKDRELLKQQIQGQQQDQETDLSTTVKGRSTVRIPLRLKPGEKPPFEPEDVVLQSGDVMFVRARHEFFTTAGLLPSGRFLLPRDYDLDVIDAMAYVGGPIANGGFSQNNISGTIVAGGIGDISPSMLVILRKTSGGGQIPIQVDLNDALRDPRHRVLIRPGDLLVLQQTPGEAVTRYFTTIFDFVFGVTRPFTRGQTSGSVAGAASFP